jgi:hypothetical protein
MLAGNGRFRKTLTGPRTPGTIVATVRSAGTRHVDEYTLQVTIEEKAALA